MIMWRADKNTDLTINPGAQECSARHIANLKAQWAADKKAKVSAKVEAKAADNSARLRELMALSKRNQAAQAEKPKPQQRRKAA